MPEYYPASVLVESRRVYGELKAWGTARKDVRLIGGWAVYELVEPAYAMQSRDVDLVLRSPKAFTDFDANLAKWGLKWRTSGRRTFADCVPKGDPESPILVDVLQDRPFQSPVHRGRTEILVKPITGTGFLPTLEWMVRDKVETIPHRVRDRIDKQAKDLLDLNALVFHSLEKADPRKLLETVPQASRTQAALSVAEAKRHRPEHSGDLDFVADWLQA